MIKTKVNIQEFVTYAQKKAAINEEQRRIRFIISSDKVDRHNERVEVAAIADAIPAFSKNPVALACHQHRLPTGDPPVIGSWDTDSFKAFTHHSEMDLIFATTELGEKYWNLYKNKHMRAISCGFCFRIIDAHNETIDGKNIYVITKLELYEISPVAVGANREALSKLKGFDFDGNSLRGNTDQPDDTTEVITNLIDEKIQELRDLLFDELENIKSLIIEKLYPDQDGFADKGQLGPESDQTGPAGNTDKNEHIVNVIRKALENLN